MTSMVFRFLFCSSVVAAAAGNEKSTCADITAAEITPGSALLQVKKAPVASVKTLAEVYEHAKHGGNRTCDVLADPFTASLDAAGFLAVTSTCCAWKMETFFNRLLESMGYEVCSKPHVQGLMHWFTCVPAMDFSYVLTVIEQGSGQADILRARVAGACTGQFWSKTGEACPAIEGTHCDNPCTTGADPFTASLDAAGFLGVTSTCCAWKTETFFNRLLESLGYIVCSKPHVQGLMHWFTCVPAMDFNYLLTVIENGNEQGCKFWSKTEETCPVIAGTICDNPCKS